MGSNILIVDDTKNIRMMVSKCLASDGHSVDTADNGYNGVELFKKNRYDLVILDIRMPHFSGTEVLKAIKEIDEEVPVIIITAFPTVKNAVECIKYGAVDYIRKPFTPDKIKDIVKSIVDRDSMSDEDTDSYELSLEYAKKYINKRDFDRAAVYLKKAISIDIKGGEPFNLLGSISELKEDFQTAEKYYKVALQFEPDSESIIENLNRIQDRIK